MINRKRFWVVLSLGLAGAAFFWIVSRYPNLNAKAMMAHSASVADTLSVWPIFEVRPEFSLAKKVLLTTLNWSHDNWKGMTFGVFFAAVFLTLFSYLQIPPTTSPLANTFFGFLLGTPLGVCVNCAAPIFKGILKSRRIETAFAAMLSSPTMNIVVLTMLFSLFPFYMAVTKVVFTLFCIFVGVPLISRLVGTESIRDFAELPVDSRFMPAPSNAADIHDKTLIGAIAGSCSDLLRNFWFMVYKTVPLMLLAGFLGSLLSHLIPLDAFMGIRPGFFTIVLAAVVGVCLPTPIAFDIILVNALYSHGLPPSIALTLLCTLGIFSIYSFFLVWASTSHRWAVSLFCLVFHMGDWNGACHRPTSPDVLHRQKCRQLQSLEK